MACLHTHGSLDESPQECNLFFDRSFQRLQAHFLAFEQAFAPNNLLRYIP